MRSLLPALLLSIPTIALAQTVTLSHSGYLLNGVDQPASATVPMRFRIFTAATGGTLQWTGEGVGSAACPITVIGGYYAVRLGEPAGCGAPIAAALLAPGQPAFLEVELDGIALAPRIAVSEIPIASQSADTIALRTRLAQAGMVNDGTNPVDWTQLKGVPAGFADGTDADHVYTAGGGLELLSGAFGIAAGGVDHGRLANDAASLSPVSGGVLSSSGGTIASTGPLSAPAISATAGAASTVPLAVRGASGQTANLVEVRTGAGTLVTSIDQGGFVTLPGDPTATNHAATKAYVDAHVPSTTGGAVVQASAPASPYVGQIWYATGSGALSVWTGSTWVSVGGSGFGNPSTPRTSVLCPTPSNTPCAIPAGTTYLIVDSAVYGYPTALDLSLVTGTINVKMASGWVWGNGGRGGNSSNGPNTGGDGANFQHWGWGGTKNNAGSSASTETGANGTSTSGGTSTSAACSSWWGASGGGGGGAGGGAGGNQCGACAQASGIAGNAGRGGTSGFVTSGCPAVYGSNPGGYGAGWGGGGGATAGGSGGGGSYGGGGGAGDNFSSGSGGQVGQNGACAIGSKFATLTVNLYKADGVSLYPTTPASALGAFATVAGYWFNEMTGGSGTGAGLTGSTPLPSRWNGNASAAPGDLNASAYYGTPTANHGFYCYY